MKARLIKYTRRFIQWTSFIILLTAFIPLLSEDIKLFTRPLIEIQFFPSLLRNPLIAVIIIFVTLVFGRIYCSSICPFATMQDVFLKSGKKYNYRKITLIIRYTIPSLSLIILLSGFPSIASIVDPYSYSGRIINTFNYLIINPLNKLSGIILREFLVYIPEYPVSFNIISALLNLSFFFLIVVLIRRRGRLFCNTLCPVGAILSIPSRFSLFQIQINKDRCTKCGACERICKTEAINSSLKTVDNSKCVACFNCLSVCRFDALEYGIKKSLNDKSKEKKNNYKIKKSKDRRSFIKKTAAGAVFLTSSIFIVNISDQKDKNKLPLAVPPGCKTYNNLLSKCTACSLCINRCPTGVLQTSSFIRFGTPHMNYNKGFCEYKCKICSDVCPTNAISNLDLEKKQTIKIGESVFERKFCVVETDKTSCGACAEICPTGAIDMIHIGDSDSLEIPHISTQYCIGCGACQYVCPVIEKNAIYVNGYNRHETAEIISKNIQLPAEKTDSGFAF